MALKLSTGLVNKLMDTGSFKSVFALCFIDIYSGSQPADADSAATGTKLVTITNAGDGVTGLSWATSAVAGALSKNGSVWQGTPVATGTAGWFRLRENTDAGTGASTSACRVDGAISTSGAQMNLASLTVTTGAPFVISAASFTLPNS